MLHTIWGPGMELREEELLRREQRNRKYMMDLKSENLLLNYNLEAGRYTAAFFPEGIHGGWEAQTCQLRGHFLGHWLSAAAMRYHASGDGEIKAKADAIVHQLALCQEENGGQWVGAIPEKYLYWIAGASRCGRPSTTSIKSSWAWWTSTSWPGTRRPWLWRTALPIGSASGRRATPGSSSTTS